MHPLQKITLQPVLLPGPTLFLFAAQESRLLGAMRIYAHDSVYSTYSEKDSPACFSDCSKAKDVCKALKKRLQNKNPRVQWFTLTVPLLHPFVPSFSFLWLTSSEGAGGGECGEELRRVFAHTGRGQRHPLGTCEDRKEEGDTSLLVVCMIYLVYVYYHVDVYVQCLVFDL